jgi:DNA-binding GntR family transcriptional regulator
VVFTDRSGKSQTGTLLREKAYHAIKKAILDEEFKPGQILSEKLLIEFLGMSKTPIKSALDRLETEGFVVISPKQGILVKELSITKVNDIFQLRMVLEMFVCQLIAGKLKADQRQRMERNIEEQEECAANKDEIGFTKADSDFHVLLCEFSGNEEIYQVMNNYQAHLYRFALNIIRRVENRMQVALQDHRAIYNALLNGHVAEAQQVIKSHLIYGQNVLSN